MTVKNWKNPQWSGAYQNWNVVGELAIMGWLTFIKTRCFSSPQDIFDEEMHAGFKIGILDQVAKCSSATQRGTRSIFFSGKNCRRNPNLHFLLKRHRSESTEFSSPLSGHIDPLKIPFLTQKIAPLLIKSLYLMQIFSYNKIRWNQ